MFEDFPEWAQEWMTKRYNEGISPDYISFVRDFLHSVTDEKFIRKIYKMPWDDILNKSLEWHEKLEKEAAQARFFSGKQNDITDFITFKDGHKWVKIHSAEGLDFEGNAMGHCVGRGYYDSGVKDNSITIYSLRDNKNMPHVTIEVSNLNRSITQIQGKGNKSPVSKYLPHIKEFIQQVGCDYINMKEGFIYGKDMDTGIRKLWDVEQDEMPEKIIAHKRTVYTIQKNGKHAFFSKTAGFERFYTIVNFHPDLLPELSHLIFSQKDQKPIVGLPDDYIISYKSGKIINKNEDNKNLPDFIDNFNSFENTYVLTVPHEDKYLYFKANMSNNMFILYLDNDEFLKNTEQNIRHILKTLSSLPEKFQKPFLFLPENISQQDMNTIRPLLRNKISGMKDHENYVLDRKKCEIFDVHGNDADYPKVITIGDTDFSKNYIFPVKEGDHFGMYKVEKSLFMNRITKLNGPLIVNADNLDTINGFLRSIGSTTTGLSSNVRLVDNKAARLVADKADSVNLVLGKNSKREAVQFYDINNAPDMILNEIDIHNNDRDLVFPSHKIKFITTNLEHDRFHPNELVPVIKFSECNGDIDVRPMKVSNKYCELHIIECKGKIDLPADLSGLSKLNLTGTWNFRELPEKSHPDLEVTMPDGTITKGDQKWIDVLNDIKEENIRMGMK